VHSNAPANATVASTPIRFRQCNDTDIRLPDPRQRDRQDVSSASLSVPHDTNVRRLNEAIHNYNETFGEGGTRFSPSPQVLIRYRN
jgi:hypothetical protein